MKQHYLPIVLALSFAINITHAANEVSSLKAELQAVSNTALNEMATEVAIKINISGTQRMLVEKIVKESLLVALNIDAEKNKSLLKSSTERFETILVGLQTDDKELKITETRSEKVLEQLTKVSSLWDEFKSSIEKISNDTTANKNSIESIHQKSQPLLKATDKLVQMYGDYCGENLNELATVINLAGRQRMLTQKMTAELLLIANDNDKSANQMQLKKTVQHFDEMLGHLVKGNKEQKLPETTHKTMLEQFGKVQAQWDELKPIIETADTSKEALQKTAEMNLTLLAAMDKTVEMYIKFGLEEKS